MLTELGQNAMWEAPTVAPQAVSRIHDVVGEKNAGSKAHGSWLMAYCQGGRPGGPGAQGGASCGPGLGVPLGPRAGPAPLAMSLEP